MQSALRVLLSIAVLGLVACGDGEEAGAPKIRTTEFGTVILEVTDEKTGLLLEIQNDTVYVKLSDGASEAAKALSGKPLGGDCEVDGEGGVRVARRFPIFWRAGSSPPSRRPDRARGNSTRSTTSRSRPSSCARAAARTASIP